MKIRTGASLLVGSNIVAQVISISLYPVVTRLYEPHQLGVYATIMSIVILLEPAVNLNIPQAIMMSDGLIERRRLSRLALLLTLVVTLSIAFVLSVSVNNIKYFELLKLNMGEILFIPIGVFLLTFERTACYWLLRSQDYWGMATSRVLQAGADRGVSVIGALWFLSPYTLLVGRFVGGVCYLFVAMIRSGGRIWVKGSAKIFSDFTLIKKYSEFTIYGVWVNIFYYSTQELPTLLISIVCSFEFTGLYVLCTKIIRMPIALIGDAIGRVLYSKVASSRDDVLAKENIYYGALLLTAAFGLVGFGLLSLVAKQAFDYIFGSRWAAVGELVFILSPAFALLFVDRSTSWIYIVSKKQRIQMYVNALIISLTLCAFFTSFIIGLDQLQTVYALSTALTISYIVSIFISIYVAYNGKKIFITRLIKFLLFLSPSVFALFLLHMEDFFSSYIFYTFIIIQFVLVYLFKRYFVHVLTF